MYFNNPPYIKWSHLKKRRISQETNLYDSAKNTKIKFEILDLEDETLRELF